MKQLLTVEPKKLIMEDVQSPEITADTEVLVKVKAAGICGSDVHIYHGTQPVATYPRVMGHEITGVIEKIGKNVTKVKAGDRVIVDNVISCGKCYPCSINRPNICTNLKVRGVHVHGGFREYITADQDAMYLLPDELSFSDAVMIEPMSIAFQVCFRAQIMSSDTVFIFGAGTIGKSLIKVISATIGADIIVADISDERLEEAKALGVKNVINSNREDLVKKIKEYTEYGPTVSIDAVGVVESLSLLADITSNAGRIITLGFLANPSSIAQVKITAKELDVRGARLQNKKFIDVIKTYKSGKIKIEGQVSHVMPFEKALDAFKLIDSKDKSVTKVVLQF
ncbi:MAG: zinc-binding alcohol dehydrogenase family protein [Endomicrobium sp.]|nr:zinc-binding alcohol dehydrogenase family protein [Endomicrobium sp.]